MTIEPVERTLVLIKPDATSLGQQDEIIQIYKNAGLSVRRHKWLNKAPRVIIEGHYAEHKGRDYYDDTVQFMTSGMLVVLELSADNAIQRVRDLNGPTNPDNATEEQKNCIRAKFGGKKTSRNAVHASDSPASAARELWLWFESGLAKDEEPSNGKL